MVTKIKEEQFKQGTIEPERIQKIEQQLTKNEK